MREFWGFDVDSGSLISVFMLWGAYVCYRWYRWKGCSGLCGIHGNIKLWFDSAETRNNGMRLAGNSFLNYKEKFY